jgi:flagellar assembly protein FliH
MSEKTPRDGARLRILPAERAGRGAQAWSVPVVEGPLANRRRDGSAGGSFERLDRATWEREQAKAREAGLAAGRIEIDAKLAELDRRIARLDATLTQLAQPLAEVDAEVERQLVQLALTVARHLVRRELKVDPAQLIAVIRETVSLLPIAARETRVHLHPEDAALVREKLATAGSERAWTIVEDPVLARGGCRVTTESSEIDARLETRIAAAIAQVLGEERTRGPRDGNPA